MNKKLISILIANLFIAAPVVAQDTFKLEGSVSLGGVSVDDGDAVDAAKLNQFRDLSDGGLLGFDLRGRSARYWLDLFGENVGRDDYYVNLRGGAYGAFKYRLYSDQLKHNFLFGGLTPYANAGGTNVTATLPNTNTATWNAVDIAYKRRDTGAMFEFQGASPWYFRVDGNQVEQSGNKLGAASGGMSPGNGMADIVFPTEFSTRNASVEGGYAAKTMHFSVSWLTSKFENDNEVVNWYNGYFKGTDTVYLPFDNKYSRIAANGTIRKLPLGSTLAVRFTKDELESDGFLGATVLGANGASLTTLPNADSFDGKVENKTFTVALASTPMRGLDTRLYYNKIDRDDKSTHVTFTGTASSGTPYENEPYSFERDNWGVDAYYRVNRQNRVGVGYDVLDIERHRFDFDESKDKRWFVEWKTSMLDNVSARVKYQDLTRDSNFLLANDGTGPQDVAYWNRFLQAYDAANLDQKSWKATLDFSPAEFLDISIEGITKENKYRDMTLGRLKDTRREVYASLSYGNPDTARFTVFGDVENVKYDSRHRVVGAATQTGARPGDPSHRPELQLGRHGPRQELGLRRGGRLPGHREADGQGLRRVLQDRRLARLRGALGHRGGDLPAGGRQLRRLQAHLVQPQGHLRVQQVAEHHGGLRLREVRLQGRAGRRLPLRDPGQRRGGQLHDGLPREPAVQGEHPVRVRDLEVLKKQAGFTFGAAPSGAALFLADPGSRIMARWRPTNPSRGCARSRKTSRRF